MRQKKFPPKAILMALKPATKKEKTMKLSTITPMKTLVKSPTKKTPPGPSSSLIPQSEGTLGKIGMCKSISLPMIALKEYRGRNVLAESLMTLFYTAHMMYIMTHKVTFVERVMRKKKVNLGVIFTQHVQHSLKMVSDRNPIYIGAFLVHLRTKNGWLTEEVKKLYGKDNPYAKIIEGYSSDKDESPSDEEQRPLSLQIKIAPDSEGDGLTKRELQFAFPGEVSQNC
ncbi:hypothetical protein R1sor_018261 [Riccia sorocarpa]|uniref:Uncharacterized protein n=1 Tax=Riccia sorocarpa TaxID=122646 RepID=A0ABD3IAX0_9MARC